MKSSPALSQIGIQLANLIKRYHTIIFTLTVVVGVSVAVLLLNNLLSVANTLEPTQTDSFQFDQQTIEQIDNFSSSAETQDNFTQPPGRSNPFIE